MYNRHRFMSNRQKLVHDGGRSMSVGSSLIPNGQKALYDGRKGFVWFIISMKENSEIKNRSFWLILRSCGDESGNKGAGYSTSGYCLTTNGMFCCDMEHEERTTGFVSHT